MTIALMSTRGGHQGALRLRVAVIVPILSKTFPTNREVNGATSANYRGMGYANSRRCALWVSLRAFAAAEELAHSIGLDVDTFIESTLLALREHEAANGRPEACDAAVEKGHVISMTERRERLRRLG